MMGRMKAALSGFATLALVLATGAGRATTNAQQTWQADIQIRTLEITKTRTSLSARVVVYSENDDEARDARLLVLLPPGVGIDRLAPGCAASASPSMVPSLRAAIGCDLGSIPDHGFREVVVSTTLPPNGLPRRFGVFTWSGTPDPVPGNNYAERAVP